MKLKTFKKTVIEVRAFDLEEFVSSIYGGDLDIVAIEEMGNDSNFSVEVPKQYNILSKEWSDQIRKGDYPPFSTAQILECLYEDGYIEKGEYLINISW